MTHQYRSVRKARGNNRGSSTRLRSRTPTGGRWHRSAHGGRSRYGAPPSRSLSRGNRRSRTRPSAGRGRGL